MLFIEILNIYFRYLKIVNSSILGFLVKRIKLFETNSIQKHVFKNFLESLLTDLENKLEELKNNQYLQVADWDQVKELAGLFEIHHNISDMERENKTTAIIVKKKNEDDKSGLEMKYITFKIILYLFSF